MKLIFNFIFAFAFFGLVYYAIWQYSPETFHILTEWAARFFDFVKTLIPAHTGGAAEPAKSMLLFGLGRKL